MFAPDFLKQGKSIAWSSDFNLPFRAANFLFLRDPGDKYFLVMDSSNTKSKRLFKELNKSLPSDVALGIISPEQIPNLIPKPNTKYRFAFLDTVANPPFGLGDDFKRAEVSVVFINSADKSATFFEKRKNSLNFNADTSLYAGNSGIFAAVFAADKDMFECNMKKAFSRLSVVADVLRSRSETLEDRLLALNRSDCIYSAPNMDYLQDIVNNARDLSLSSSFVEDIDTFTGLRVAVDGIASLNNNLIQQSCPGIY
jgi:hypothetical protein